MDATNPHAEIGDVIVIEGNRLGQARRTGEILEVFDSPGHLHYRVHWEDDRETLFYPSGQATVVHHVEKPRRRVRA